MAKLLHCRAIRVSGLARRTVVRVTATVHGSESPLRVLVVEGDAGIRLRPEA
ncbi:MAG TPA: hypothetical protein VGM10_29920 [Actinocrinis sp.]